MHPVISAWHRWLQLEVERKAAFAQHRITANTFYIRNAECARQWFNELMHRGVNECAAVRRGRGQ